MPYVGQNLPHDSAAGHVTGRSQFIDDAPPLRGELLVEIVGSPVAHGRLTGIDAAARAVPGIVAVFTAADIPGHNRFGPVVVDEVLLAHDELDYLGQPVLLLAGETRAALDAAKRLVKIEAAPLPPIFTIAAARAANSYLGPERQIARGDATAAFASAPHRISGQLAIGGQEHFYLESQAAIAVPGEFDALTITSSTQHPSEVQAVVAEICGLPFNAITVITPRMGGGFGGKETQGAHYAAMAALVARKTGRPARIVLDRDTDMAITGKRHPFLIEYEIGFDDAGQILAYDARLWSDGGCTTDLSFAIMERAMLHSENAYFIPHVRIRGQVCKTNLPSNTAFRGFGGPQGVAGIENAIGEVAAYLGRDAYDIRQLNCYDDNERNVTPYGQIVRNNTLPPLFDQLRANCAYDARRAAITRFNQSSPTHLRGLAMTAVKFGISLTKQHLNQANALVNIYTDGTVMVSTGGTEMGQGLNTRVRQIVADALGVTYDRVRMCATNTDKNNNTSPTAASAGTDLNGNAALDACHRLRARLTEFAAGLLADPAAGLTPSPGNIELCEDRVWDQRNPARAMTFRELVTAAYLQRISLGERGFYATPGVDYNRDTGRGNPFLYYTNGAAVAEVCLDRFTGMLRVTRVDLLIDIGLPINPGLDRGQITGGFIQGQGWCTTEELKYGANGELLSHSPTTYKIPNVGDVPPIFNVNLFANPDSEVSLKKSKAMGEPPLLLGISVWAAVKDALQAAAPPGTLARLALPATGEEILLALGGMKNSNAKLVNYPQSGFHLVVKD